MKSAAVCRTLSHDPLALDPNCIHIVDAQVFEGSTYHLVASDDNDFNALLPAWGIREAYIGPGNTLASVSLLLFAVQCFPYNLPIPFSTCSAALVSALHEREPFLRQWTTSVYEGLIAAACNVP